eukprot:TRINITY_DN4697_c0_g1_i1.p1 TRINITY_DN4697_c0_g1~~TRINITY_DN4697_c0_g1_i1.p1  ORF type:complete len:228 (+),score=50.44 TRINITY_DN4697_c0_g1_i1:72-686(+)
MSIDQTRLLQMDEFELVKVHVKDLRASFKKRLPQEAAYRKYQLQNLQRLIVENRDVLKAAVWKDLHKSGVEVDGTELSLVEKELQYHLDHVDDWMKPKKVGTDVLNFPGSSEIRYDPLGLVLVMGTWNYPLQLSLLPCIGAISAGNCVLLEMPSDKYTEHTTKLVVDLCNQYMDPKTFRAVEGGRKMTQARKKEKSTELRGRLV